MHSTLQLISVIYAVIAIAMMLMSLAVATGACHSNLTPVRIHRRVARLFYRGTAMGIIAVALYCAGISTSRWSPDSHNAHALVAEHSK